MPTDPNYQPWDSIRQTNPKQPIGNGIFYIGLTGGGKVCIANMSRDTCAIGLGYGCENTATFQITRQTAQRFSEFFAELANQLQPN